MVRHDPLVKKIIWQACRDIRKAKKYFSLNRPLAYLTSYTTYIEHGIPARVALSCGIPVWSFGNLNHFGKRLSVADAYQTADTSNYRKDFEKLDQQEQRLHRAKQLLDVRLAGGIDPATSYMRRSAYASQEITLPGSMRGAVVVFLHDFYDSPHVFPGLIFDDFWQWICFTIDELVKSGVSFYLKPHPNQISLSDGATKELRERYPKVNWLPAGATNIQLAREGIACGVTVYGTVAHELAYLGIPSICCARHPHHAFEFSRTARSRNEYSELLRIPAARPLPVDQMRRQALVFYYMHNLAGSESQISVRQAFIDFWAMCNTLGGDDASIESRFHQLTNEPEFDALIHRIMEANGQSLVQTAQNTSEQSSCMI